MKKAALSALFASILFSHSASDAQTLPGKLGISAPSSPVLPVTTNPAGAAAPANSQQAVLASTPSAPIVASPADVASQTAKEILAANNQVVSQVASMYQNLGLFITIIVTLVGVVVTGLSYVARKSVQEFFQEWTKKLESLENEMKDSLNRLRDAVAEAEGSANKAAGHAQSIEHSEKVLNKALLDVDRLRTRLSGEQVSPAAPQAIAEAAPAQPPPEPQAADEDADVAARLQGKIDPSGSEGPKS